jgi:hypothetical protein
MFLYIFFFFFLIFAVSNPPTTSPMPTTEQHKDFFDIKNDINNTINGQINSNSVHALDKSMLIIFLFPLFNLT